MRARPRFCHSSRDRRKISTLRRFTAARTVQPALTARNASSHGMTYVNTHLPKHRGDEAPFIRWNKIDDQSRDGLKFESRIRERQRGVSSNEALHSMFERPPRKGAKAIDEERKSDSARSDAIKSSLSMN